MSRGQNNFRSAFMKRLFAPSRCFKLTLFVFIAWIIVVYAFFYEDVVMLAPFAIQTALLFRGTPSECTFPNTDPFDPSLQKLIIKHPPLDCSNHTANIVYMDNFVLRLDKMKLRKTLKPDQTFSHCKYQEIDRKQNSDKGFEYIWLSKDFTDSIALEDWNDNVVSECFDTKGIAISRSYFPLIRRRPKLEAVLNKNFERHLKKNRPLETLSIIMLGIDGMSKQHFERAMPKTRNFLLQNMGAIELQKYNKLAFETFPNVLPLLTGHTPEEFYRDWKYNRTEFVDQINKAFLWTEARNLGYRTGMMLDTYDLTAFHYQKKGFKVSPVDYYQRATVIASSRDKLMRGNNSNCAGDQAEVTQIHDYWLQMASTFGKDKRTPFLAYSFAVRITHDDPDFAYIGDEAYYKFLQDLVATKSLNNTVILWFSDHGPRFGPVRSSYHGRIETSTPYLFWVFPPWFEKKYPEMIATLRINQHRLSSHFDVYETLRDLLYMSRSERKIGTNKERGISLFREIPKDRTCRDAGIPSEFCACGRFSRAKIDANSVEEIGLTLLHKVNSFVGYDKSEKAFDVSNMSNAIKGIHRTDTGTYSYSDTSKYRDICARLSLAKVESLYQVSNIQLADLDEKSYKITIRTVPGNGLFEGVVNYKAGRLREVIGSVNRINLYRGQAECVHDPWLRQYCYCVK